MTVCPTSMRQTGLILNRGGWHIKPTTCQPCALLASPTKQTKSSEPLIFKGQEIVPLLYSKLFQPWSSPELIGKPVLSRPPHGITQWPALARRDLVAYYARLSSTRLLSHMTLKSTIYSEAKGVKSAITAILYTLVRDVDPALLC